MDRILQFLPSLTLSNHDMYSIYSIFEFDANARFQFECFQGVFLRPKAKVNNTPPPPPSPEFLNYHTTVAFMFSKPKYITKMTIIECSGGREQNSSSFAQRMVYLVTTHFEAPPKGFNLDLNRLYHLHGHILTTQKLSF